MITSLPASVWTKQDLSEYQVFDVRSPAEREEGVLPQAECVALYDNHGLLNANFLEEFQAKRNENKKLAFVCRGGHRSMIAANWIQNELGLESVNLDGGMSAFKGLA